MIKKQYFVIKDIGKMVKGKAKEDKTII